MRRLFLPLAVLLLVGVPSSSETAYGFDPVAQGRDALIEGEYPWYDAPRDCVRYVPEDGSSRSYTGGRGSGDGFGGGSDRSVPTGDGDRSARRSRSEPIVFDTPEMPSQAGWLSTIVWIFVGVLLAAILYWVILVFLQRERTSSEDDEASEDGGLSLEQEAALPLTPSMPRGDFLSLARKFAQEGDFNRALIYMFSYQLVALDRTGRIRLARGKTNRQYLRELHSAEGLRGIFDRTMVAFEEVFFGGHELSETDFQRVWSRLDEFHRLVGGTA